MNKKDLMLHIVEICMNHSEEMPSDLKSKLEKIREGVQSSSDEEIEKIDGVVTEPASEQEYNPNHPVMMLLDTYSDIEKFAFTGEKDKELYSAVDQLRGLFDIPDRYFP